MYRLRRFYVDGLGVPDNRFYDVTLDLSGATGDPIDSIVWLRNGAGKTTMLALLLALILPDRRDFLAHRVKGRTLEDLVLGTDTGHVAAEWVDPTGGVLLTGAVYEWMGRTRPREHNTKDARSRFRRCWWCVTPDQAVDGTQLEDLPFTSRSKGAVDFAGFRQHIERLAVQGACEPVQELREDREPVGADKVPEADGVETAGKAASAGRSREEPAVGLAGPNSSARSADRGCGAAEHRHVPAQGPTGALGAAGARERGGAALEGRPRTAAAARVARGGAHVRSQPCGLP